MMKLFDRMLARKTRTIPALAPAAPVMVIGDLHGRRDLLEDLLSKLERRYEPPQHLVFLGDYIDRGAQSASVLRLLHHVQVDLKSTHIVCLLGNHEEMLLRFLAAPERHGPRWMR